MRIQAMSAGRHIKLPPMPRTRDDISVQSTPGQRPTRMRTNPVHRLKRPRNIKQRNNPPSDNKLAPFPNRHIANTSNKMATHV